MEPVAEKTIFTGFAPNSVTPPKHRVAVLAYDGVVLGDLATPLEIFGRVRDAEGRSCYDVRVCAANEEVESEHLVLKVPWRLSSVARADTVMVPGIDHLERNIPPAISRALRSASERGARIASICTGAFVLARFGLLDGMRATTHWRAAGELARLYPRIKVDAEALYVDNGGVLTSAGAAAGLDLCLHLVRRDYGASVAAHVARAAVMPLERVDRGSGTKSRPVESLLWVEGMLTSPSVCDDLFAASYASVELLKNGKVPVPSDQKSPREGFGNMVEFRLSCARIPNTWLPFRPSQTRASNASSAWAISSLPRSST